MNMLLIAVVHIIFDVHACATIHCGVNSPSTFFYASYHRIIICVDYHDAN